MATQYLKTMETTPIPSLSELTELKTIIEKGVHGIQLSEETAIGLFPVMCVKTIRQVERSLHSQVEENADTTEIVIPEGTFTETSK